VGREHSGSKRGELILASDGQVAIPVGPWAKEKLFYIERYCHIFNQAMRGKWPTRVYIDLFAGPGRCVVQGTGEEINGSPLVALKCEVPFSHYFFNDLDATTIAALEKRAVALAVAEVRFFNQDCNQVVGDLLRELDKLPRQPLVFCFIDPFNWEIEFASIATLAQGRRMDLAITFHTGSIKRWAHRPPAKLDTFFPDAGWRQGFAAKRAEGDRALGAYLLNYYKQGLRGLGYNDIQERVSVKQTKGVPLYHLIFASKHPRGREFWDKISQRKATGQMRLAL